MFTLAIIFVLIWNNEISFLVSDFTHAKVYCQKDNINYIAVSDETYDKTKTYHQFPQPKGKGWKCIASAWGSNFVYPSQYDMVNIEFEIR